MPSKRRGRSLENAIVPSLLAPAPVPASGRDLVKYAGGRRELAKQLSGMDGPPATSLRTRDPARYERERIAWRTASRRAQRWDDEGTPGKQRRGEVKPAELTDAQRHRLQREARARKRRALGERGMRARLFARVRVPSPKAKAGGDTRDREMPAGGPGVYIDPSTTLDIIDQADEHDEDAAAEDFMAAFWEAYGMPEGAEIEAVYWLKIWPEGTPEP